MPVTAAPPSYTDDVSQAEPSAPLDPEPGVSTTTTATTDAPGEPTAAAPATQAKVRIAPAAAPSDGAASARPADAPSDDPVHRRFWGEDEPAPTRGGRAASGRRGRRARRQQWVVRNVSTWSVLKVSALFFLCMWAVLLVAGVILWEVADTSGMIEKVESFWAEATGSESVVWDGEVVFRSAAMAGAVLALASVAFAVLFSVLFNLICDMTGGIRLTVLQVEPRAPGERRAGRRR